MIFPGSRRREIGGGYGSQTTAARLLGLGRPRGHGTVLYYHQSSVWRLMCACVAVAVIPTPKLSFIERKREKTKREETNRYRESSSLQFHNRYCVSSCKHINFIFNTGY